MIYSHKDRRGTIQDLTPDKCPTCSGVEFEVIDASMVLDSLPPWYGLHLECTACHWASDGAWYQNDPLPPEIVRSEPRYEIVDRGETNLILRAVADAKPFPGIVIEDAAATFRIEIPFSEAPITSEADYWRSVIADE